MKYLLVILGIWSICGLSSFIIYYKYVKKEFGEEIKKMEKECEKKDTKNMFLLLMNWAFLICISKGPIKLYHLIKIMKNK